MRSALVLLILFSSGCAATLARKPVGLDGDIARSRYQGTPLAVAGAGEAADDGAATWGSYVVKPGDTLYSLARKHAMTVQELSQKNGITDPALLRVGQSLTVRTLALSSTKSATVAMASKPSSTRSRYPLRWPLEDAQVTSRYGSRFGRAHDGIDIGAPEGTQVRAAAPGSVVFSAPHGGYGNLVVLRHDDGLVTVYAHHSINLVRKGQRVNAGQIIAKVGTTGRSTGPHLHFEVRKGAVPQNPLRFLPP